MPNNKDDYLLVIWEYLESLGKVSEKDISVRLNLSPPTVWEYLGKLEKDGMIKKNRREIRFTPTGYKTAIPLVRMHRITEVFAYKYLEVPWEDTHSSVMELEHLFEGERGEKLFKNLGYPDSCPHGNPTDPVRKIREISASYAEPGEYTIQRVSLEEHSFLKELASVSAFPETKVRVEKGDYIEVETQNGSFKLDQFTAQSLKLVRA